MCIAHAYPFYYLPFSSLFSYLTPFLLWSQGSFGKLVLKLLTCLFLAFLGTLWSGGNCCNSYPVAPSFVRKYLRMSLNYGTYWLNTLKVITLPLIDCTFQYTSVPSAFNSTQSFKYFLLSFFSYDFIQINFSDEQFVRESCVIMIITLEGEGRYSQYLRGTAQLSF